MKRRTLLGTLAAAILTPWRLLKGKEKPSVSAPRATPGRLLEAVENDPTILRPPWGVVGITRDGESREIRVKSGIETFAEAYESAKDLAASIRTVNSNFWWDLNRLALRDCNGKRPFDHDLDKGEFIPELLIERISYSKMLLNFDHVEVDGSKYLTKDGFLYRREDPVPPYHIVAFLDNGTFDDFDYEWSYPSRGYAYASATKAAIDLQYAPNPLRIKRLALRDSKGMALIGYPDNNPSLYVAKSPERKNT